MMKFIALLSVCTLLFLQGCATGTVSSETRAKQIQPLSPQPANALRFQDIPAPSGFKLVPKESFIFENNSVRFAFLKYTGHVGANRLVEFYRARMPEYGWQAINIIEHEARLLNFEKTDQTCVVTIDSSATSSSITIAVAPKSIKKGLDK